MQQILMLTLNQLPQRILNIFVGSHVAFLVQCIKILGLWPRWIFLQMLVGQEDTGLQSLHLEY